MALFFFPSNIKLYHQSIKIWIGQEQNKDRSLIKLEKGRMREGSDDPQHWNRTQIARKSYR